MESKSTTRQTPRSAPRRHGLVDLPNDPTLDDAARLAAQLCGASVAGVSLLEDDGLFHLGRYGFDLRWTPASELPVGTTMDAGAAHQILSLPPESGDPAGDLTLEGRSYRSYAAAPLRTPEGTAIGALFVLNSAPMDLSQEQMASLEALGRLASARLTFTNSHPLLDERKPPSAPPPSTPPPSNEAALAAEKNFSATVLDTVGSLVVMLDTAGRILRFNRHCELLSGYTAAQVIGTHAWDRLIPREDVASYREHFERARRGDSSTAFESDWMAADGTRRRISWSTATLRDAGNRVSFVLTTGLDITVQSEAETAIRESERRYREIAEGSLGVVYTHDLSGRILSINQQGAQSLGREVTEVVGQNLVSLLHPRFHHELESYFAALRSAEETQGLLHLHGKDGELRTLAYRNRLVQPMDLPPYILGFAIDVTGQIDAEDRLRRLIRQSNSVLESTADGIYGVDLEGRVTVVNPAAAKMLGYRPEELLGRNMHAVVHHSHPDGSPYDEAECPIRQSVGSLAPVRVAHEVFWRKDGTSFPVEYVACPQIEQIEAAVAASEPTDVAEVGQSRAVGVVVAFTDISERNALDRMKDEFISTVSHELRTPLTSLRAALGLVAGGKLAADPHRTQQMMEIAVDSTDRLVRLVNDILDLERIGSGKAGMHFTHCSLEVLFERTAALLGSAAERAGVRLVLQAHGVSVWGDPDRLLQMLTHLVSNAIKFAPEWEHGTETEVVMHAQFLSGAEASIEIRDHGRGIPEHQLGIIFERFKQVDASDSRAMGGTGLGLAICKSIVRQHGGSIWATSTLGEGSTFHVTLPTRHEAFLR